MITGIVGIDVARGVVEVRIEIGMKPPSWHGMGPPIEADLGVIQLTAEEGGWT